MGFLIPCAFGYHHLTSTTPSGATGPTLADNPIIGPNPVAAFNDTPQANAPPGVGISYDGKSATGSFLLDTGAQASFISQAMAAQLGVQYEAGTYGTANPILISTATGQAIPGQFTISASGAGGGTVTSAGFYLSTLSLQTKQGTTINFDGAPVAVQDVTVTDSATGKSLTLAGDLGMNFFEPSATTNFGSIDGSAFNWMTINQPAGLLGLIPAPEAPSGPLLGAALALLLMCCRWPRCRPTIPAR